MATVETILRDLQALSPDERHQIRDMLRAQPPSLADELQRIREKIAQPVHLTEEDIATINAMLERATAEIGAAWTSDMSALEAVQEQRREL
jgi:hypothetical protein